MKLTLFVNHACNLRCIYCYTGEKFHRPMPFDLAKRAIDFGMDEAALPSMQISFFGGEPLMEPNLVDRVATWAKARAEERKFRIFFAIATNGTLLDDERLAILERHRFTVQVSLDGGRRAQEATRPRADGGSSYDEVAKGVERLVARGFDVRVVSVIDPANAAFLADSFESVRALGVKRIQFSPNYSGAWDDAACERFEVALKELGDRYIAHFRAHRDVRLDPLNGKIVTHLARGYQKNELCKFGQQDIAVSPRGNLYPCDRLVGEDEASDDICIGNLDEGLNVARRDALIVRKNTPEMECATCEFRPRCMYWCGCANYETTGHIDQTGPIVCWFERSFIAESDRVATILYGEKNATFLRRFYVPEAPIPTLRPLDPLAT